VYIEYTDYRTMSDGSGSHEMLTMAGGRNIAADLTPGYPYVDPEWVIEENPGIIMRRVLKKDASCGYDEDDPTEVKELRNEIMSRPELANIMALKNEKVYCYATDISTGLSYWTGIGYMAKWCHPELFEDLDPQAIHQEYLTEFQGLDINLDEHGVFVYPPLEES
jgi:iron complex transport system substrate-binding protein